MPPSLSQVALTSINEVVGATVAGAAYYDATCYGFSVAAFVESVTAFVVAVADCFTSGCASGAFRSLLDILSISFSTTINDIYLYPFCCQGGECLRS